MRWSEGLNKKVERKLLGRVDIKHAVLMHHRYQISRNNTEVKQISLSVYQQKKIMKVK